MNTRMLIILIVLFSTLSCTKSFNVVREAKNTTALSDLKHVGIICRLPDHSTISIKMLSKNFNQWIEPYIQHNKLQLIEGTSSNMNSIEKKHDCFLQFSGNNEFQYYQSVGIIKQYLSANKEEFEKIKTENNLDGFILYEIDCSISAELQFSDLRSMIVIVDAKNRILYMDHQFDTYGEYEFDNRILRENILDHISNRFIELMMQLKFIMLPQ